MKIFSRLYDATLRLAAHRLAVHYLAVISFVEAIFFPIPPDVMLAPMTLARRQRAWHYALVTTVASVLGGAVGYALGYFAFEPWVQPALAWLGYEDKYAQLVAWFDQWGIWVIFLAGFSPVPYKVFTVGAGAVGMLFWPFLLASFISRGARYCLVVALMRYGGVALEARLKQYMDAIGWALVLVIAALFAVKAVS